MSLFPLFVLSLLMLAVLFPAPILDAIVRLKQHFRAYLVQKYGNRAFETIRGEMRRWAATHAIPAATIDAFLKTKRDEIVGKHGDEAAESLVGE